MTEGTTERGVAVTPKSMLIPLALAQFVCSFAGSNMNVAISSIGKDLGTSVQGVQTAITLFLLVMAALMIPGSKFTDLKSRAQAFGLISGMGGVGAAAGPLIGGLITTTVSWRASFLLQGAIVLAIIL